MPMTTEERSAYNKQYNIDNKEKINEHKRQHYADNNERLIDISRQYRIDHKEEVNERGRKRKQQWKIDNPVKYRKLHATKSWRRRGMIGDLSFIYDVAYITATHCWVCKKTFKDTNDRCLDHCHSSGEFRQILCRSCNVMDSWKKY